LTSNEIILLEWSYSFSYVLVDFDVVMEIFEGYSSYVRKYFFDVQAHLFHLLTMYEVAIVDVFFDDYVLSDVSVD